MDNQEEIKMSYLRIEPDKTGEGFNVYEIDEWPNSSVLAGNERKSFKDAFNDKSGAVKAYPKAEVSDYIYSVNGDIGACPPPSFDPYYAGESWDEE